MAVSFDELTPGPLSQLAQSALPSGLERSMERLCVPALLIRLRPGSPGAGSDARTIMDRSAADVPWNRATPSASVMLPPSIEAVNRTVPSSARDGQLKLYAKYSSG